MTNSYEKLMIDADHVPDDLVSRINIPLHIEKTKHLLLPYIKKELIPEKPLDIFLLSNLDEFVHLISGSLPLNITFYGVYISNTHASTSLEVYKKVVKELDNLYGITNVSRAVLLPKEDIKYWTVIHELLHDVFNVMPKEKRDSLVEAAVDSYKNLDDLLDITDIAALNLAGETVSATSDGSEICNTLLNLSKFARIYFVDEFITYFFTDYKKKDKWNEKHLPKKFREVLQKTGYNMVNPPEIKN